MKWELKMVSDTDWQQDDSDVYVLINWVALPRPEATENEIRLDIMQHDEPIVSFQGTATAVRKHAMRWLEDNIGAGQCESEFGSTSGQIEYGVSLEHAAYVGAELAKAEIMKTDYIQD